MLSGVPGGVYEVVVEKEEVEEVVYSIGGCVVGGMSDGSVIQQKISPS